VAARPGLPSLRRLGPGLSGPEREALRRGRGALDTRAGRRRGLPVLQRSRRYPT